MMKKIGALVLAAVMMMMVTAVGFADGGNMTGQAGVIGEFLTPDHPDSYDDTVIIYKEITAYNPEGSTVNAPAVTFNYTIDAATVAEGTTITDNASRHAKIGDTDVTATVAVKAGVGAPTITGTGAGVITLVPGTNTLQTAANGKANRFPLTVDFSSINFTTTGSGAGVYRYVINETTTEATKNASGIVEGTVANQLFMDVYVDGTGAIYGYVLFTNNTTIDGSASEATASTTAGKIEGFVGSKAAGETYENATDSIADKYYTFDLTITKDVENDNYIVTTHHQFPFTVTLTNSTVTADVLPIMTVSENATQAALTAGAIAGTWNPTIADDATVTYVGIPTGTTITIKETNNVIGASYTSASEGADTDASGKIINYNDESNTATVNCNATALTIATENHTGTDKQVKFTNTLLQISPTGVTLRVAPYILMLAAGIFLFILAHKHRKANEEA